MGDFFLAMLDNFPISFLHKCRESVPLIPMVRNYNDFVFLLMLSEKARDHESIPDVVSG